MLMTQHSRLGKSKNHNIIVTYVGPYVRVQCTCQDFNILKRKELSDHAAQAARDHISSTKKSTPRTDHKYANFVGPDPGERNAAYRKIWYPSDAQPFDPAMQGGSDLRHNSPRKEKHHRMVIEGIRVR